MFDKEDKKSVEQLLAEVASYFGKASEKHKAANKTRLEDFLKRIKRKMDPDLCYDCEKSEVNK
jgi:hypothetical protein